MKDFSDKSGGKWVIDLTVGTMRRVKAAIGIDLTAPQMLVNDVGQLTADESDRMTLAQRVCGDVMLFIDVLFAIVTPQALERGVDVLQFCELLPPDNCRIAWDIFREEWESFFRLLGSDDQASVVRAAADLEAEMQKQRLKSTERVRTVAMDEIGKQVTKATDDLIQEIKTSGTGSTSTPASSGSSLKR